MANFQEVQSADYTDEEMQFLRDNYDNPAYNPAAQRNVGLQPHGEAAKSQSITINGAGQVVESTSVNKSDNARAIYAGPQARPGFVTIGGIETPIEAAKAGGLLPMSYQEGDKLPFDVPGEALTSTSSGNDATDDSEGDHSDDNSDAEDGKDSDPSTAGAEHHVAKAGEVLDGVDQAYGPEATDRLLSGVAEAGEIDVGSLPQGVTPAMADQVMSGFIAQANGALSEAGSSVTALEEVLSDDELRDARRATLSKSYDELQRLGKVATQRLAGLPTGNPEAFNELLSDMSPEDRSCLKQDRSTGEWTVNVPGEPVMSFGAAILTGKLAF